jgi:hypothetical protein
MTKRRHVAGVLAPFLVLGVALAATPTRAPTPTTSTGSTTTSALTPRPPPVPQPGPCDVQACYVVKVPSGDGYTYKTVCSTRPAPDGTACDDGNACTVGDACAKGTCVAGPTKAFADANVCTSDACDPKTGEISHVALPDATYCGTSSFTSYCINGGCTYCMFGECLKAVPTYDCHVNRCSAAPGEAPDVGCWLADHPTIRDNLWWLKADGTPLPYGDWEAWRIQDLQAALLAAWSWKNNGMTSYAGTAIAEPPPNLEAPYLSNQTVVHTVFDEQTVAWPLFVARAAHLIAAEVGHWVPWSICDLAPGTDLHELVSAEKTFHRPFGGGGTTSNGLVVWGSVTPAHPTYTFKFLADNGLIGATRADTIANLLEWTRRLSHASGTNNLDNLVTLWQYPGLPPVSRTLGGTTSSDPVIAGFYGKQHWTMGCYGTTGVLREVLRAANIPVEAKDICGHTTPHFMSESSYLSHGDDPYGFFGTRSATSAPPMADFLVDEATYQAWFVAPGYPASCANVGRRDAELAVAELPEILVWEHCDDLSKSVADPALTSVFQSFQTGTGSHFSLAELDAMNFWARLDQRTSELGGCAAQCSPYQSGFCSLGNSVCPSYPGPVCPFAQ